MASGFEEIFGNDGLICKVRANFGKSKEICMNAFNGKTYIHISDKSKCFVNGKFDANKSKSVTLTYEESMQLKGLVELGGIYDAALHQTFQPSHIHQQQVKQQYHQQQLLSSPSQHMHVPFQQYAQQQQYPQQQQQQQYQQQHQQLEQGRKRSFDSTLIAIPLQPEVLATEITGASNREVAITPPAKKRTLNWDDDDDFQ